jgi:hypothetical protein
MASSILKKKYSKATETSLEASRVCVGDEVEKDTELDIGMDLDNWAMELGPGEWEDVWQINGLELEGESGTVSQQAGESLFSGGV